MSNRTVLLTLFVCLATGALVGLAMGGARLPLMSASPAPTPALTPVAVASGAPVALATATATAVPTSTAVPSPTAMALPTVVPSPTVRPTRVPPTSTARPLPTNTPTVQLGRHGLSVRMRLGDDRTTCAVGEQIRIAMEVENHTDQAVVFGIMGVKVENDGSFKTISSSTTVGARSPYSAEGTLSFAVPGTYTLRPAICFSATANCGNPGADWEEFTPSVKVEVR